LIKEGTTEEDALDKNKISKRTPIEIKGVVPLGLKIIKSKKKEKPKIKTFLRINCFIGIRCCDLGYVPVQWKNRSDNNINGRCFSFSSIPII
jgi:hypothetical protein